MPPVDVSIIIVAYNSAPCVAACVQSIAAQKGVRFETIVVDNASADDTLAVLKGLPCRVISSVENLGFGRGNNLGFANSSGRYIYLLNPDARLTAENLLAELCRHMDAHPRWGVAGTRILSAEGQVESPPSMDYPGARHITRDFSKLPGSIAWIMGASMLVRREVYERLGGFDPAFFLYSEETDFCLRVRELGFEIGYVPEVAVSHIGAASEDLRDPYDVAVRKLKGLILFREKHYAPEDCVRLARRDLRRAQFRARWNGLLARFRPPRSHVWKKARNYQGVWEVSRDFLARRKGKQI